MSEPPPYPPPYPPPPDDAYSAPPPPDQAYSPQPYSPPPDDAYSAPPPPDQLYSPPPVVPYPPPYQASGEYYPQPVTSTNGFAIASLILGILGPCGLAIGLILAIVFGFIGLSQTKGGRQNGRGMAIAGLILSGLWIVGLIVATALYLVFNHDVQAVDLKVGDCIETAPADNARDITTLPKVSCDKPHESEVYAILDIPGDRWPGESAMRTEYGPKCAAALEDYAKDPTGLAPFALYPSQEVWDAGHHEVTCMTETPDKRTGSVKK